MKYDFHTFRRLLLMALLLAVPVVLEAEVKLTVLQKGVLIRREVYPVPSSAEQQLLEKKLLEYVPESASGQAFEQRVRNNGDIPRTQTAERCNLPEAIYQRVKSGIPPENIPDLFAEQIRQWYANGFMTTGTQMVPASLFLRQFYDNHKDMSNRKRGHETEELSAAASTPGTTALPETPVIRVSAEGEGATRQEALREAIRNALSQVNTHWSNRSEASSSSGDNGFSSSFSEKTIVIYGANIRHYNIVDEDNSREGSYRILINAEVEKTSGDRQQKISTFNLTTEYERLKNRKRGVRKAAELLADIPGGLFRVAHKSRTPDDNLIRVDCTVSLDLAEYRRWIGQITQILSRIAPQEFSYATELTQLIQYFKSKVTLDRIPNDSLFICDIRNPQEAVVQQNNEPDSVCYRKYMLPERLIKELLKHVYIAPRVIFELLDDKDKLLAETHVEFPDLGIEFMNIGPIAIKGRQQGINRWKSAEVPLLVHPFFLDGQMQEGSLQFSFEVELTLSERLFKKEPKIKIYAVAQPGKKADRLPIREDHTQFTKEEGKEKYHAEEYAEAFRIFQALAKQQSADPEINLYLGRLFLEWKKDEKSAIECWKKNPKDGTTLNELGDLYYKQGLPGDGLECYRLSAALKNAGGLYRYGKILLPDNPVQGIALLESASEKGIIEANFHVGEYYRKNQNPSRAFVYYKRGADSKEPFRNYAQCCFYTGLAYAGGRIVPQDRNAAILYLTKITQKREKYREAQYLCGKLKKDLGKRYEAQKHFKKSADAGHIKAMYEYGCLLLNQNMDQAIEYLKKASAGHPAYYYQAGIKLFMYGEEAQAEEMFLSSIKSDPDPDNKGKAYWQLWCLCKHRSKQKASHYLEQAVRAGNANALCLIGEKAMLRGDLKLAESYFAKAYNHPEAVFRRGHLYEHKKFKAYSLKQALFLYGEAQRLAKEQNNRNIAEQAEKRIRILKKKLRSRQD